jgi:hypothetical protein
MSCTTKNRAPVARGTASEMSGCGKLKLSIDQRFLQCGNFFRGV